MIFKFIKKILLDIGKFLKDFLLGFLCGILMVALAVIIFAGMGFLFKWLPGVHVFLPDGKSPITGYIAIGFMLVVALTLGYKSSSYLRKTWKDMVRK